MSDETRVQVWITQTQREALAYGRGYVAGDALQEIVAAFDAAILLPCPGPSTREFECVLLNGHGGHHQEASRDA